MIARGQNGAAFAALLLLLFAHAGATLARSPQPTTLHAHAGPPVGASAAAPAAGGAAEANGGACDRATFRTVIDVGHTAAVPGATSAHGVPEYAFNLALGQATTQALEAAGFAQTVLMITEKPPPAGLVERARRANAMHADLFLAVHHDSVPDALLQTWQYDGQDYHYNDDYPGYALFVSNDNADRAGSLLFGKFLGKELQARDLHFTAHYTLPLMGHRRRELLDPTAGVYRYDQLVVLRDTRMPAVLLEAGSIINRQEELELGTAEHRATTSAAVAAAVEDFCDAQARRPAAGRLAKTPGAARALAR